MPEFIAPEPVAQDRERARVAIGDDLAALLHHPSAVVLLALLDNAALGEAQLCLLLERKDLPGEVLEEIGKRKPLLKSYRVKRALCFHPRGPRLVTLRLIRDLYLMDLVQLALSPAVPAELKRNAEEQLLMRLPQIPLGQKITLARRGPGRACSGRACSETRCPPRLAAETSSSTALPAARVVAASCKSATGLFL